MPQLAANWPDKTPACLVIFSNQWGKPKSIRYGHPQQAGGSRAVAETK